MNIRDIQKVSLDIIVEIDRFCQENDIKYSLGYGGLIGAIRHKGCIPWDDDLDVIMPRPDYEKFIKIYHSPNEDYKVFAPELGNCYYAIARVCEMNKTRVLKYYQWTDEKTGVFVDIFPIDACPQDNGIRIKQINGLCRNACKASRPFKFEYKLRNLKILYQRIKFRNLDRQELISQYLTEISTLNYEKANYVCNLGSPYWEKDIHPKIVFEKYIRVPFENIEVSIIESYDVYLRNIYGNYMVLPSPEKQRAGHTANKFFWIDEKC